METVFWRNREVVFRGLDERHLLLSGLASDEGLVLPG
jgi:hypothetical protein